MISNNTRITGLSFLVFNTKTIFNYLWLVFIKIQIFCYFDLKNHIFIKINKFTYTIGIIFHQLILKIFLNRIITKVNSS